MIYFQSNLLRGPTVLEFNENIIPIARQDGKNKKKKVHKRYHLIVCTCFEYWLYEKITWC